MDDWLWSPPLSGLCQLVVRPSSLGTLHRVEWANQPSNPASVQFFEIGKVSEQRAGVGRLMNLVVFKRDPIIQASSFCRYASGDRYNGTT